jgi:uncharacterized protein YqiB (DUF1249 family)
MKTLSSVPTHLHARGVGFATLMELYENNYLRMRLLCPQIRRLRGEHVSQPDGLAALYLEILEQSRFTTQVRLSYRLGSDALEPQEPERFPADLRIRVYHDARQAEWRAGWDGSQSVRQPGVWPFFAGSVGQDSGAPPDLLCRWRRNRLLYRWLGFCLAQGHGFPAETATGAPPARLMP